ncbi:hypothetical protein CS542_10025 [Pedobacter sp. IW39]|nr:hypothetical protein CS542_10025 [Pedobacter sp. IW39]
MIMDKDEIVISEILIAAKSLFGKSGLKDHYRRYLCGSRKREKYPYYYFPVKTKSSLPLLKMK